MLYLATFSATRRVLLPSVVSRLVLTRFISSTPTSDAPKKATKKATAKASATKASTPKKAAKASTKPKAKTVKKDVKAAKKPVFKRADLKVPTRAATPWVSFIGANSNSSGKSIAERQNLMKELAEKWKNMPDAEKKPFYDQAKELNEKIKKQFEEWKNNVDPAVLRAINKERKAKGLTRISPPRKDPKMPNSSFIRFVFDFRKQQDSSLAYGEILKRAGPAWRALPEERKKPYTEAFAKEFQAYREQTSALQAH